MKNIKRADPPYPFEAYAHIISPLDADDGGGFLITFPDLPGCMSDGETIDEALQNGRDAFHGWLSACMDTGRSVPRPAFVPDDAVSAEASGKFIARLPKSVHHRLSLRAKAEGVSLNTLVVAMLSEGLGQKSR